MRIARQLRAVHLHHPEASTVPYNSPWTAVSMIGDLLVRSAQRPPDRLALTFPGEQATFAELLCDAQTIFCGLLAQGIRPGEHVGLLASNCVGFTEALFGVVMMGATVVPLSLRHRSTELCGRRSERAAIQPV